MKVIVTGASGFVGTNVVSHLQQDGNIEAIPLSLRTSLPTSLDAKAIIHLAGKAHDLENASNPDEYFQTNYQLTRELFELFLKSETKDFIFFSSVKAVADTVQGVLTEDVTGDPKTPYGQSKLKAEEYLLTQNLPSEKRLFIIRPCMIHGPGNKGNLNLLYKVVKKGIPYPLGSFDNTRSFLSIDNLLYAIKRIINEPSIPGGVYNFADDEPLSTNALIKIIAQASGAKGQVWRVPKALVSGVAKLGDGLRLPLNSERLKKLTESYVVSNEKIKEALKIDQLPVSSTDGMILTIKSFES